MIPLIVACLLPIIIGSLALITIKEKWVSFCYCFGGSLVLAVIIFCGVSFIAWFIHDGFGYTIHHTLASVENRVSPKLGDFGFLPRNLDRGILLILGNHSCPSFDQSSFLPLRNQTQWRRPLHSGAEFQQVLVACTRLTDCRAGP